MGGGSLSGDSGRCIDVLAAHLRERDIGDHEAFGKVAEMRVHPATRVQQLVDTLLVAEPRPPASIKRP
jgi:hypothetical protein